jgi:hypothetical protein
MTRKYSSAPKMKKQSAAYANTHRFWRGKLVRNTATSTNVSPASAQTIPVILGVFMGEQPNENK